MAQKKITDLQLRSDFDGTVNLPGDDTSQTWRVTGEQIKDYVIGETVGPTIQKFTSGSGTYTTPAGVKWIRVRMAGGGGGGGASGVGQGGAGGAGGNTTFGTTLLSAGGGAGGFGGASASDTGSAGGSSSLGTGPIGLAQSGSPGDACLFVSASGVYLRGGKGGDTPIFAGGAQSVGNTTGAAAVANTGGGGGGGGTDGTASASSGGGGGSGGYVEAIINSPASTYAYAVGAGGTAGAIGSGIRAGGAGGSGMIIVEEFYV
jgi:hypothetical protein